MKYEIDISKISQVDLVKVLHEVEQRRWQRIADRFGPDVADAFFERRQERGRAMLEDFAAGELSG